MEGSPLNSLNSDEYLQKAEKKDFNIPVEKLEESSVRLGKPFENLVKSEEGFEAGNEKIKIRVHYKSYTYQHNGEDYSYPLDTAKIIDSLVVTLPEQTINIIDILPQGTQIIVWPGSDKETGSTRIADENGIKNISILGEIDNPKMFFVLLHEIGHILDDTKIRDLGLSPFVKEMGEGVQNADLAEKIRRERAASGFALKVMRPYLRDNIERQDMLNFFKMALKTYYDTTRVKIHDRKRDIKPGNYDHSFDDYGIDW